MKTIAQQIKWDFEANGDLQIRDKNSNLIYFEDSESDGEESIAESNLPPVALRADRAASHEEYLLTRLRAAKARVEAEQIRMQYFEATGRMPPDSEDEDEDEDGDESE